jgi:hypothetical protein
MRRLREILADSSCELFLIGAQISAVITSAAMANVNQRLQLRLLSRKGEAQLLGPFDSSMAASEMAALSGQVVTTILATGQQFDPALLRPSCRVATRPWRSAPANQVVSEDRGLARVFMEPAAESRPAEDRSHGPV